jgi:alanine-glyoxylate transaminase/serine-glyoxylate transaminase/serine-pyruvate transaminase
MQKGFEMLDLDFHPAGRHFLQIPGPTPVPDRILRAMSLPTIDHRGPEFGLLGRQVLTAIREVFKTRHPVVIYPGSGTGAWEAALSNTLSPGDHILIYETGHFASLWAKMAKRLGLSAEILAWAGPDDQLPHAPNRSDRATVTNRLRTQDQSGLRGTQRDFDRGAVGHPRGPRGVGCQ